MTDRVFIQGINQWSPRSCVLRKHIVKKAHTTFAIKLCPVTPVTGLLVGCPGKRTYVPWAPPRGWYFILATQPRDCPLTGGSPAKSIYVYVPFSFLSTLWPTFTFVRSRANASLIPLHSQSFSGARRFVLSIHTFAWQSRANTSLIHSIHASTFTQSRESGPSKLRNVWCRQWLDKS